MDLIDLLVNTDYDVQQYIGDILKPIREQQRKQAHEMMFIDTLDELDYLHSLYKMNRAIHGRDNNYDGGCLASFPIYLRYLDDYEGGGTTEDYFPHCEYNSSLDSGDRWGEPRRRLINGQYESNDALKGYFKIREEINSFRFE